MRRLILIVLVLGAVVGGLAAFLWVTTPRETATLRFPLTPVQRELLARVPEAAEWFALIPTAALFSEKLTSNPVTRVPVEQWLEQQQQLPQPWLLGGADVVAWRNDKRTSYAIRLDTFRAFLVRTWMMWSSGNVDARWDGRAFVINAGREAPIAPAALDEILELARGLPEGDLLVVQRNGGRGAFPPLARPTVSSAKITPAEILITSRARNDEPGTERPEIHARFPRGALIAATFARPPRILDDLRRLFRADIASVVQHGGTIALYDIDPGTLLPKPEGVVAVPATAEGRAAMEDFRRVAELVGETGEHEGQLVASFDRRSMSLYKEDAFEAARWPANRWSMRMDPQRMVPVLERLGDNTGLRIAAGRLHRAARDLRRWIRYLQEAQSIEAADSATGEVEELRVRIASK